MSAEWFVGLAIVAGIVLLVAARKGLFWKREPKGSSAGPIINGKNRSHGVEVDGDSFLFPLSDGIHYFTQARGPINGDAIAMRYMLEAAPDVRFVGVEDGAPATMSLYFCRDDIDWSGREDFARYYCPIEYRVDLNSVPRGVEQTLVVPLDASWVSAISSNRDLDPQAFLAALADVGRWGPVFGGNAGRGHGAHATGDARFHLLEIAG